MNKDIINILNSLAKDSTPFFVIINFDKTVCEIYTDIDNDDIKFEIDKKIGEKSSSHIEIKKIPIEKDLYKKKFEDVIEYIKSGNSYLLNLTSKTEVECDKTLDEIYKVSDAKFKLLYKDKFVCFSPERFIKIENNKIYTYPMKGTIDAKIDNAKEIILSNEKEMAEHTMVVDLLRNDLSIVSKNVRVDKFRFCEKINAGDKELLQVSSEIVGDFDYDWKSNLGDILDKLLPAGSITGTPKKETIRIIKEIEEYDRDFFTGIFGYFDGKSFDSAVMIRFIEKIDNKLVYKSGGGITIDSIMDSEYQEMLDKVYIPC